MTSSASGNLRHDGRRAGRVHHRVEHDLCLHTGDAVDVEPVLALEILYQAREVLVVEITAGGRGGQALRDAQILPQPAHVGAAHARRERLRDGERWTPQEQEIAEPVARHPRDGHRTRFSAQVDGGRLLAEAGEEYLVGATNVVGERKYRRAVEGSKLGPRALLEQAFETLVRSLVTASAAARIVGCAPGRKQLAERSLGGGVIAVSGKYLVEGRRRWRRCLRRFRPGDLVRSDRSRLGGRCVG